MNSTCSPGEEAEEVTVSPLFIAKLTAEQLGFAFRPIPAEEKVFKIMFYVLAMAVDIVGNGLVIFIVAAVRKMRTPTHVLLVNLAVADLLVALLCMWVHLGVGINNDWPFSLGICKVNMFAQVTAVTSSVLTLTAISIERFVAIVFPLRGGFTLRLTAIICLIVWVIACGIASPQLHVRYMEEHLFKDRHVIKCVERWPRVYIDERCNKGKPAMVIYHMFVGVVLFAVPILVMIVSYTVVCVVLLTRVTPGSSLSAAHDHNARAKRRVVRMLVILLVVFIVCWLPTHVLGTVQLFQPSNAFSQDETVSYVTLYVAYLNSALNPILYAGFNDNFRRGFRDVFKCHRPFEGKSSRVLPEGLSCARRGQQVHAGEGTPVNLSTTRMCYNIAVQGSPLPLQQLHPQELLQPPELNHQDLPKLTPSKSGLSVTFDNGLANPELTRDSVLAPQSTTVGVQPEV